MAVQRNGSTPDFQQTFKNIDNTLRQEAGCTTELDYTEQTSWTLFLKYLDDLERAREMEAELVGRPYRYVIDEPHRWSVWAAPKTADGEFDHNNALTGDELRFRSQKEKHELSDLYEVKIRNMGNAGRSLGKTNPLNDADLAEFIEFPKIEPKGFCRGSSPSATSLPNRGP